MEKERRGCGQVKEVKLEDAVLFSCLGYVEIVNENGRIEVVLRLPDGVESHRVFSSEKSREIREKILCEPKQFYFRYTIKKRRGEMISYFEPAKMHEEDIRLYEEIMGFDMRKFDYLRGLQER